MAVIGQLGTFINMIIPASSAGIGSGITKQVAGNPDDPTRKKAFISGGFFIVTLTSVFVGVCLAVFGSFISRHIVMNQMYAPLFRWFGLLLPLMGLNVWALGVLNGLKSFRLFNAVSIAGNIAGLIITVGLTKWYLLEGALYAAILTQALSGIISLIAIFKVYHREIQLTVRLPGLVLKGLFSYSLMALVSACTIPLSQLLIRNFLIVNESVESAGLWEALNRISGIHLLLVTTTLITYYLPRLSEIKENKLVRKEVYMVSRYVIPAVFCSSLAIFIFRKEIINILFTPEFGGLEPLFMFQMAGDLLKICSWLLAMLFIAKAKAVVYISGEVLFTASLYFSTIVLVRYFGLIGATYSYALNYFLYFIYCIVLFRFYTR